MILSLCDLHFLNLMVNFGRNMNAGMAVRSWVLCTLFVKKVHSFKDSRAALCLLGTSSACLENSCCLCERGQLEDQAAQAFPSTGIIITTRISADPTVHPLPQTLLSHLIWTVAFAGISWKLKLRSLPSSITGKWLILFQALAASLHQNRYHC